MFQVIQVCPKKLMKSSNLHPFSFMGCSFESCILNLSIFQVKAWIYFKCPMSGLNFTPMDARCTKLYTHKINAYDYINFVKKNLQSTITLTLIRLWHVILIIRVYYLTVFIKKKVDESDLFIIFPYDIKLSKHFYIK